MQDHTSITRFIETKWNLGAMTYRDANAADMTDYFDFRRPSFLAPPALPAPVDPAPGLFGLRRRGAAPAAAARGRDRLGAERAAVGLVGGATLRRPPRPGGGGDGRGRGVTARAAVSSRGHERPGAPS